MQIQERRPTEVIKAEYEPLYERNETTIFSMCSDTDAFVIIFSFQQ